MKNGLGRKEHWDPQNEKHLITEPALVRRAAVGVVDPLGSPTAPRRRRTKRHAIHPAWPPRLWQRSEPKCTAFGSEMALVARKGTYGESGIIDPHALYDMIVAIDRAEGRHFNGGATTLAAMKALQQANLIGEYRWTLEAEVAFNVISFERAIVFGTNWYESMWERDAENIARITPRSRIAGGHLWAATGYIVRPDGEDLIRHHSTWKDGVYYFPVSDVARLLYEDGEAVDFDEVAAA